MTVTSASVYTYCKGSPEQRAALGVGVLVMRWWPRGIAWDHLAAWLPDAGPSEALLNGRKGRAGPEVVSRSWPHFAHEYIIEQAHATTCRVQFARGERSVRWPSGPVATLAAMEQKYGAICLLCCEGNGQLCHRRVLADLVRLEARHSLSVSQRQQVAFLRAVAVATALDGPWRPYGPVQPGMRVGIGGSRDYADLGAVAAFVDALPEGCTVVSGHAPGVDRAAEEAARAAGLAVVSLPAAWQRADGSTDRGAGLRRNLEMIAASDRMAFFHDGDSTGTAHAAWYAHLAGTPVAAWSPAGVRRTAHW